jgi:tetratricopeptide (TPR) repeat protein
VDPQHGFSWLALGALLTERAMLDEAAWALERAIALEGRPGPGPTVGAKTLLGEVLRRQGRLAEARQACMEGIEAIERSDHMYRDSSRAIGLLALGRAALDQRDVEAAVAACRQAATQLRGRPRTLGGRYLLVQALAGLARAGDRAALAEARALLEGGEAYDGSWLWFSTRREAVAALAGAEGEPQRA